jgi:hypothetical protein
MSHQDHHAMPAVLSHKGLRGYPHQNPSAKSVIGLDNKFLHCGRQYCDGDFFRSKSASDIQALPLSFGALIFHQLFHSYEQSLGTEIWGRNF